MYKNKIFPNIDGIYVCNMYELTYTDQNVTPNKIYKI